MNQFSSGRGGSPNATSAACDYGGFARSESRLTSFIALISG